MKQAMRFVYNGPSLFLRYYADRKNVTVWIIDHQNGIDKIAFGTEQDSITLQQRIEVGMMSIDRFNERIKDGILTSPENIEIENELYNQAQLILSLQAQLLVAELIANELLKQM
jgi:hypothetical protein